MLCVSPAVAGTPLPNTPLLVRVYVASGVLLLVCTVTVLFAVPDPVNATELGEMAHAEPGGTPPQERETFPANPHNGVSVIV